MNKETLDNAVLCKLSEMNINKQLHGTTVHGLTGYNWDRYINDPYFNILAKQLCSVVLTRADEVYVKAIIDIIQQIEKENKEK